MPHAIPTGPGTFPRGMLLGAGLLVAATLALVTFGRLTPVDPGLSGVPALQARELRFADRADGGVAVTDARDGSAVIVLAPGQDGFVRGAMRGLARDRRMSLHGAEAPFRLTRWADGRLTLEDMATGRMLEMTAFGRTNTEAFMRFLSTKED
ncbi:photosynthetic complex assembly protein PuhC [Falsiroseomonas sp. CW058]|uniref:photosynthetic complex assembly protein PuhC n=1 Tax=Falsiroseomonas sp. CW058 TaxID=3388664 RepID=UPI003D319174